MADPNELTMDELRERIRAAGITVAVRALDSRTIRTVEPAVKFVPEAKGDSRE